MNEPQIDLRKAINEVKAAGREDEQFEAYVSDIEPLLDALDSLQRELDQCIEQGEIQMMENAAAEAALEARLSKIEEAARPFIEMRFDDDGIAGHDATGHPLSHEGMARKRLREALAGERR